MFAFDYAQPTDVISVVNARNKRGAMYIGGGTSLLDLMKGDVEHRLTQPGVNHLALDKIEQTDSGLHIGAAVRNSDLAEHPIVRTQYPLLRIALLADASPLLRNMTTVGGNLMQRTRCDYFVDSAFHQCNKRRPGSGCAAIDGNNRLHAILGASTSCVAVNSSDMCVALLALDARVRVRNREHERFIAMEDFHRLPQYRPDKDTNLASDELILGVELPRAEFATHHHYLKVRDRANSPFALVSVGVGLRIEDGFIRKARIALGGVAHKPWYAQKASEELTDVSVAALDTEIFGKLAVEGAKPLEQNGYKVMMAKNAVSFALSRAMEGA